MARKSDDRIEQLVFRFGHYFLRTAYAIFVYLASTVSLPDYPALIAVLFAGLFVISPSIIGIAGGVYSAYAWLGWLGLLYVTLVLVAHAFLGYWVFTVAAVRSSHPQ